jgi:hypothetical protein
MSALQTTVLVDNIGGALPVAGEFGRMRFALFVLALGVEIAFSDRDIATGLLVGAGGIGFLRNSMPEERSDRQGKKSTCIAHFAGSPAEGGHFSIQQSRACAKYSGGSAGGEKYSPLQQVILLFINV